jgi:hypothetical protein
MSFKQTLSASGSTTGVRLDSSTIVQFEADGTFGSGTLTPELQTGASTWVAIGTETLTADGLINAEVPRGSTVRLTLAGATDPSIVTRVKKIR